MIALRGPIRRNTKTKNRENSNASVKAPSTTPAGEWIWTGFWAFGSLPQGLDHTKKSGKKAINNNGARPFVYKFQEVTDASTIEVPSLQQANLSSKEEDEEDNDAESAVVEEDENNTKEAKLQEQPDIKVNGSDLGFEKSETNANEEKKQSKELESLDRSNEKIAPDADEEIQGSEVKNQLPSTKEVNDNVLSVIEINKKSSNEKNENDVVKKKQNENSKKDTEETSDSNKNELETPIKPKLEEEKDEESKATTECNENNFDDGRITFASENAGEKYTDAGLEYSQKCPIGGCWKGYFENVSVSNQTPIIVLNIY